MFFRKKIEQHETQIEEVFNAVTHGIGIIFGIVALVVLVSLSVFKGSELKITSVAIYGATIILMFVVSTLYHAITHARVKPILKMLDHISIYFLIAGTYTPVMLGDVGGGWGWSMFGVIWGLALFGTFFKLFFTGRCEIFSVVLYGVMGWLVLIALSPLVHILPLNGILWLLTGGLCYTLGIIFYVLDTRYHFSHFIWHLFVLAGCVCHFFAILFYVVY